MTERCTGAKGCRHLADVISNWRKKGKVLGKVKGGRRTRRKSLLHGETKKIRLRGEKMDASGPKLGRSGKRPSLRGEGAHLVGPVPVPARPPIAFAISGGGRIEIVTILGMESDVTKKKYGGRWARNHFRVFVSTEGRKRSLANTAGAACADWKGKGMQVVAT